LGEDGEEVVTSESLTDAFRRTSDDFYNERDDEWCETVHSTVPKKVRRTAAPVHSLWTPLDFGKHSGKTLPQILFKDPDWFFWAYEEDAFAYQDRQVLDEVERVYQRATSIRIPARYGPDVAVEYVVSDGRFEGLKLTPADAVVGGGIKSTSRLKWTFDMSVPRKWRDYDKAGMRIMVRDLKDILFDDPDRRMNRRRCEDFFNDASLFKNP
jgi:hypothetical protein